jgi:proteic killer suppression protein
MIKSFGNAATRRFAESGKVMFSNLDAELATDRLADLNAISAVEEFGKLKSVGLHKLKGDLQQFWAVNLNGPYRLIFRFVDGHAYDVELVDYHKG